jgi:hypothetical protein
VLRIGKAYRRASPFPLCSAPKTSQEDDPWLPASLSAGFLFSFDLLPMSGQTRLFSTLISPIESSGLRRDRAPDDCDFGVTHTICIGARNVAFVTEVMSAPSYGPPGNPKLPHQMTEGSMAAPRVKTAKSSDERRVINTIVPSPIRQHGSSEVGDRSCYSRMSRKPERRGSRQFPAIPWHGCCNWQGNLTWV